LSASVDKIWQVEAGRAQAIADFKQALISLVQSKNEKDGEEHKIIFVIDELDRCRPDFALRILEIAKHFFNINNVHFVLGVNSLELASMIKKRYGSQADGKKYLEKFISLYVELPQYKYKNRVRKSSSILYVEKHSDEIGIDKEIEKALIFYLQNFPKISPDSIRKCQRLLAEVVILDRSNPELKKMPFGYIYLAIGILLLKSSRPEVFAKLEGGDIDLEEVLSACGLIMRRDMDYPEHHEYILDHVFRSCIAPKDFPDDKENSRGLWGMFGLDWPETEIQRTIRDKIKVFKLS
ncbi:MAG: KAP family NTPase, partial [Donghicola eburneus]